MTEQQLNVYQMYVQNDRQVPFWLTRTTWGGTIAKVIHVGELRGSAPYYGNPAVLAEFYDVATGHLKNTDSVSAAGTYKTWRLAQVPVWASQ